MSVFQATGNAPFAQGRVAGKSKLLKHDRVRLIEALAQNKPEVTLLMAGRPGDMDNLVAESLALSGRVEYRDDDAGYMRVGISPQNVDALSRSTAIDAINIAGKIDYLSDADEDSQPQSSVAGISPPNRDTPPLNPYLPTGAIGAPQFVASHPTFDGRGVTVAIIDTNIDLLLPELQTAKNLDGTPAPKFADILCAAPNAIVPSDDDSPISGYLRVDMRSELVITEKKLSYQNRIYSAPAEGRYRIGILDERATSSSADLNRDGNPAGSSGLFAVLWDESTNTVWIDTNQNLDFTDEKPMTDYRFGHGVGIFGRDDPKTPMRETVGFIVQTDARHKSIFVIPGYGSHGTGVTGAAFGAGFFGGKMDGVAPAAQIISIPYSSGPNITSSFIESVIMAMKDPRVDLVTLEFGNFIPLNDGRSTFAVICDRLINKYQKLIFAAAGNGTDALNGIVSPADAREVVAVGSYISKETGRVNQGDELSEQDNMSGYSSHGPTKEGGLKPNVLAPTSSLTTKPGFLPGENRHGTYPLPPGYQIYGGTSTSTPFAAAGAALLISAAKQTGVKYDARRLHWAMMSSARFLPNYSAEMQGAGLLQVEAAWEALKSAPKPIDIVSRAQVKAVLSEELRDADRGTGIYEREGWTAGQSGERIITLTRTSGDTAPMKILTRWLGNDGTFKGPTEITLPLNTPVDMKLAISPNTSGVHNALLNLVAQDGRVVHQVMNTIVAAEQFDAKNNFTMTRHGRAEWLRSQSYFLNVAAGTPALRVDVKITEGNVIPSLMKPNGNFYFLLPPDQSPIRYSRYQSGGSWSRVISNPDPGVWQIIIDNCNVLDRTIPHKRASFTVTATLLGVAIHPQNSVTGITYTNTHGSFTGEIETALASVFSAKPIFESAKPIQYEINVPPGATRVGATIAVKNSSADLDLYLFDCTTNQCVLRDFSNGNGSTEQVAVDSPSAGKWKVVIDPFNVRGSGAVCDYQDYFLHPAFGFINAERGPSTIQHGHTITQTISMKISAVPIHERRLEAMLFVTSRVGPNSENPKSPDRPELYYPDKAILGMAQINLKRAGLGF